MAGDDEGIRSWDTKDGGKIIDKGDGERIFIHPDKDDPSIAGGVYESGDKDFTGGGADDADDDE